MTNVLLTCYLLSAFSLASAQKFDWIRADTVLFDLSKYSGYDPLKAILDNKKIVFLGELSHADGSSQLGKVELIKYLHDSLNYNVLLNESDLFSTNRAWKQLRLGRDSSTKILSNLLSIDPAFIGEDNYLLGHYLDSCIKNGKPLVLQGIDILDIGVEHLQMLMELDTFIEFYSWKISDSVSEAFDNFMLKGKRTRVDNYRDYEKWLKIQNVDSLKITGEYLLSLLEQEHKLTKDSINVNQLGYYIRCVDNLIGYYSYLKRCKVVDGARNNTTNCRNFRENYLIKNLLWYVKEVFPNEKIIVSMATSHIVNTNSILSSKLRRETSLYKSLYTIIKDSLHFDSYTIAFARYQGNFGYCYIPNVLNNCYKEIERPSRASLEYFLGKKSETTSFVSLDGYDNIRFKMRSIYAKEYSEYWSKIIDGIIFIKNMRPLNMYYVKVFQPYDFSLPEDWYAK